MNFEDIEQKLNNLKADYQATKLPRDLEEKGLWEVLGKLEERKVRFSRRPFWFASATLLMIIVFGLLAGWKKVEAALPGDSLYPVKRFSEEIVSKVSKDSQIKVENRAKEVVDLVEKGEENEKALKETAKEYEEEIKSAKEKLKSEKRQEFNKKLERHQEEFKKVIKKSSSSNKQVEEIIEANKKIREENEENKEREEEKKEEERENSKSSEKD